MAGITGAMAMKMDQDDRLLMAMPIWHSSPLNNWFMGRFLHGRGHRAPARVPPPALTAGRAGRKVHVYFGAPVSYLAPLQMVPTFADFDLSSMRCWIYGGGPISADVVRRLMAAYKSEKFYQVYGMTESGPTGATLFPEEQIERAGSIGRTALPGADMLVVKGDGSRPARVRPGNPAQGGQHDERLLQGRGGHASRFQRRLVQDRRRGQSGRGRLSLHRRPHKDIIITGGENVYSKEVEDALASHPLVLEAAVIGRPHPEWGETVVALVVPAGDSGLSEEALKAHLAPRLARYKIPREFKLVEALPHTPTGKVMKYKLREEI